MGVPDDIIDAEVAEEERRGMFEVHEDNVETVVVFSALRTQWRVAAAGMGYVVQGIDYGSIPPLFDLCDVPPERRRDVFDGIRLMEATALPILNGDRKRNG